MADCVVLPVFMATTFSLRVGQVSIPAISAALMLTGVLILGWRERIPPYRDLKAGGKESHPTYRLEVGQVSIPAVSVGTDYPTFTLSLALSRIMPMSSV
jgi:hypothetical protein